MHSTANRAIWKRAGVRSSGTLGRGSQSVAIDGKGRFVRAMLSPLRRRLGIEHDDDVIIAQTCSRRSRRMNGRC